MEGLDQKTYSAKIDRSAQTLRDRHLSIPCRPFWGPLVAILDLTGGAALHAVKECPHAARLEFKSRVSELPKIIDLFQRIIFSLRVY